MKNSGLSTVNPKLNKRKLMRTNLALVVVVIQTRWNTREKILLTNTTLSH